MSGYYFDDQECSDSSSSFDDPTEGNHGVPSQPTDDGGTESEDDEQREFNGLTMAMKWETVMQLLIEKAQVWVKESQEFGDSENTIALKPYLKKALVEEDRREGTEPTMLHILAKKFGSGGFTSLDDSTQLDIVTYLMDKLVPEDVPAVGKTAREPVLKLAMTWHNKDFLFYIVKHFKEEKLAHLINTKDGNGMNGLHHAFQTLLRESGEKDRKNNNNSSRTPTAKTPTSVKKAMPITDALVIVKSLIHASQSESIAAKDNGGNTPIHYAVHYNLCRYLSSIRAEHFDIVKSLVKKGDTLLNMELKENQFNNDGKSPYQYSSDMRTRRLLKREKASNAAQKPIKFRVPDAKESKTHKAEKSGERGKVDKLASSHESKGKSDLENDLVNSGIAIDNDKKDKVGKPATAGATLAHAASRHRAARGATTRRDDALTVHTVNIRADDKTSAPIPDEDASNTPSGSRLRSQPNERHDNTRLKATHTKPETQSGGGKDPRTSLPVDEILDWLKLHYIRTRPETEAKELLYGKVASDKNLFFDATQGLAGKSAKDIVDLVECLHSPGGFENTLSYVSLPVVSLAAVSEITPDPSHHVANHGQKRDKKAEEDVQLGRSSLVKVFEALYNANVSLILQLHVDDMEAPSHSDASIEKCLVGEDSMSPNAIGKTNRRIKVELWNWRKPDLSIDVIRFSAPDVERINLYWTGNYAVLRGWASPEGIPSLYIAKKKLREVIVHTSPGIETPKRTNQLFNDFVIKIQERTDHGVKVVQKAWKPSATAGAAAEAQLSFGTGLAADEPRHDWISAMSRFRSAMYSIHRLLSRGVIPQRVKVALIDDGVDRTNLVPYKNGDTYRGEVTGLSYWTSRDRNLLGWPWHQSTHGHGTIMANMIARVNPWVSLIVMRIQDQGDRSSPSRGSIRIHARGAARAIEDAIIRDADIISMSWTIKTTVTSGTGDAEDDSVTALRNAIDHANTKGILMFCSASDNLQQSSSESLPFSQAPNHIFRIGAAGLTGQRDGATEEHGTINWFLPGKQVVEDSNPRSTEILQYHDGSSVSTALAAGLASLVIYICGVLQELNRGEGETFANYAKWLRRDRENMNNVFASMIDSKFRDRKYLPVWYTFGETADGILAKGTSEEKKLQLLEDLVRRLCLHVKEPRPR